MKRIEIVRELLQGKALKPQVVVGKAFAPINIALCKYWGKRNVELNLPMTSSLSITLPNYGSTTEISVTENAHQVVYNNELLPLTSTFAQGIINYLELLKTGLYFSICTQNNIPHAAGLASSASGFAALVLALNQLFAWNASLETLSILARLGSGSASRSLWNGFVEWQKGDDPRGFDSHGVFFAAPLENLRVGLLIISTQQKPVSSREAMRRTVETSLLYRAWPAQVDQDMALLKAAIQEKDITTLGRVAEANAMAMHATMWGAQPPVCYFLSETMAAMQKVWELREQGVTVFFTQDAGPNLKLIFDVKDQTKILEAFPNLSVVKG